ncbi:sensor domain-containing diguanylate cyclase [Rubeoparvulum massiliense]|uniref:sensor domain-containing diguanylate cyclase n=1 Tax=Rubeoparvulum massiliense TaxID=1631346 RepID=UPI00065E1B1A|nr:diguanylate cyclase [Rubeoparvulum massiliense]
MFGSFQINRSTLQTRLIIAVTLLLLLTTFLSFIPTVIVIKHQRTEEALTNLEQVVSYQKQLIDRWITEREYDLTYLVSSLHEPQNNQQFVDVLTTFTKSHPDFLGMAIADPQGQIIFSTGNPIEGEVTKRSFFQQALYGETCISDLFYTRTSMKYTIVIATPIRDHEGKISNVLLGFVNHSALRELMQAFKLGETGQTYLMNNEGYLLTEPAYTYEKREAEGSSSSSFLSSQTGKEHPLFIKAKQGEKYGPSYDNDWGREVYGDYLWTNHGNWLIIAEMDRDEILEPYYHYRMITLSVVATVLFLAFLYVLYLSKQIQAPLQSLLEGTKKIEAGEYGYQIKAEGIRRSTKELVHLASIFNEMSLRVADNVQLLRERENKLELLSNTDELTCVANRRYFNERYELMWNFATRMQHPFSLLMVDIDFFKNYNDTYGHLAGDQAIHLVAHALQHSVKRTTDFVARYGGEEFVILLPNTDEAGAMQVGEELRHQVELLQLEHSSSSVASHVTISIGVATVVPQEGELATYLLTLADEALYQAKQEGRNRVVAAKSPPVLS